VRLVEKSSDDRRRWLDEMWVDYRQDLLGSGMSDEAADKNIERNRSQLFSNGELVAGNVVFDVLDDDDIAIGSLWLSEAPDSGEWFIYDIVVDEAFRGAGLGRRTMSAAEAYVVAHGGHRLGLNVFGPNLVARHLYESMDYRVMAVSMFKDLP
jgi:ribosomal protein S18 acetylase RimI-like enzyme